VERLMRDLNRNDVPVTSSKTHVCQSCDHVLSIGEFAEKYCAKCGDINPREVQA